MLLQILILTISFVALCLIMPMVLHNTFTPLLLRIKYSTSLNKDYNSILVSGESRGKFSRYSNNVRSAGKMTITSFENKGYGHYFFIMNLNCLIKTLKYILPYFLRTSFPYTKQTQRFKSHFNLYFSLQLVFSVLVQKLLFHKNSFNIFKLNNLITVIYFYDTSILNLNDKHTHMPKIILIDINISSTYWILDLNTTW